MEKDDKVCKEIARKYNVRKEYIRLLIKICKDNHVGLDKIKEFYR